MSEPIKDYGFSALPRDGTTLIKNKPSPDPATPTTVAAIPLPDTPLAKAVLAYAKRELPPKVYNHSMRVYYYGTTIVQQKFPTWSLPPETYLLTCLLHDIGATPTNLHATHLSFEFYGGYLALELLQSEKYGAPQVQAESVAEAIIRHQDIGSTGMISVVGMAIQIATIFDNIGGHADLVHPDTIKNVTTHFPREEWSSCFADVIREEEGAKPWCHTTSIVGFAQEVEGNKLMEPYGG